MDGDVDWLRENVTSQYTNGLEFPIKIVKESGTDALVSKPNIIVGTYHSVKGGQADHVYLFPDISPKAYKGLQGHNPVVRERKDDLIRQFYVGMTRAKESLHLCQPKNSKLSVPWR
jgi:superfamily I DNA/RNA helicase